MNYLTVYYQDVETLEVEEKIYSYRFKWMAYIHIWWLETYNYEDDPNPTTRVKYELK